MESSKLESSKLGFTMIELLIVISIIFLLFGMLIVAAGPLRQKARKKNTEGLVHQVTLFLDLYKGKTGTYPSDGIDERVETAEGTPLESGAALTFGLLQPVILRQRQPDGTFKESGQEDPIADFKVDSLSPPILDDPDARELFDGFFQPFHYDRITRPDMYSTQDDGDVHLGWENGRAHGDDPREAADSGVETPGPQNIGQFDFWSHGPNGHEEDEKPEEAISNWRIPGPGSDSEKD